MNIFDNSSKLGSKMSASLARYPLVNAVDSYLEYYAASSSHTARAKKVDLKSFLNFMAASSNVEQSKLTISDWNYSAVQRFIEKLLERGEAPATVSRRLATLKHMGRTLAEKIPGFINPTKEVKAPRMQIVKPKALSNSEMDRIRKIALARYGEKPSFIRARNLMLLQLLLETGLRAEEVRLLKFSQLDEKLEWISQVRTKGRKYRNVYLASTVRDNLKEYLKIRDFELKRFYSSLTISQNKKLPVFISTYKADPANAESFLMGAKTLWRSISQITRELKLHPHLLRHSFALDLLESSNDIRLVSQALGHSDVRVTMRYTERRDTEVAKAIENRNKRSDK
jgi:site-specific recombinase XerD